MKIVCISDTHNKHEELFLPEGDILIHAGDFTDAGTENETINFLKWFSSTPFKYKILVAGNHDFYIEKNSHKLQEIIPSNIHYLEDSGITIENINFWGSPYIPGEAGWAFVKGRGKPISHHWDLIPTNTDVLITHGPPFGMLDELNDRTLIGCKNLKEKIERTKISLHIFGHVHNDYGKVKTLKTLYINSSSLDETLRIINQPIAIEYRPTSQKSVEKD